ncbi:MAG: RNA polymerase sigma factor [Crocinitomicaceae bacterium]|nr:RNA polymerase sigma factor [Crocinitomicaceae bacterium]
MRILSRSYKNESDEKLILRMRKGEEGAFQEIYERYADRLYKFFYMRMWKDREKAEDFVHDLLTKLIQKPESFDVSRNFKTWLFSVANNMVKNEYKRQEVRSNTGSYDEVPHFDAVSKSDVERDVQIAQFKGALDEELEKMDEKHREIFELRHIIGFSNKEIAQILEINEGTVKSRIFYAIKQLSESLGAFKPTEG